MSHVPGASSVAKYEAALPKLNWDAVPDVSIHRSGFRMMKLQRAVGGGSVCCLWWC